MAKSNNIGVFDVLERFGVDSAGNLVDSSFDVRYQYNYFVQDESDVIASESALVGAQNQRFDITPGGNTNSRPPVFIATGAEGSVNPRNRPRYFEIKLQGVPDADVLTSLLSYDDRDDRLRFSYSSVRSSYGLSGATPEQITRERNKIVSAEYRPERLNFENSFSVGLVDYDQQLQSDPLQNPTQTPEGNAGVTERAAQSGIDRDLLERLKTEPTAPIGCSVSVRQEAAPVALHVSSLTPDPEVSASIIRSLASTAVTPRAAIQESFGRTTNLDSVNDGIVNTFERSQDIELIGFELASPLVSRAIVDSWVSYASLCLGYLIERIDLGPVKQSPVQVSTSAPSATSEFLPLVPATTASISAIDTGVRHGRLYRYLVRRVYYIERGAAGAPSAGAPYYGYFVASAPISNRTGGFAESSLDSRVAPPSSLDFYRKGGSLYVDCGYPVTDERTPITKFLLFSRRSPSDPYRLIGARTYFSPVGNTQTLINLGLRKFAGEVVVPASRVTLFELHDYDFQRGEMIAAACVDVHGNISSYSAQFVVKEAYPGSKKLRVECASGPRAPLGFPNLFLKQGYGGFSTGPNGSVDIVNSVIGASNVRSVEIVPTYGLASSNDPAAGLEWKNSGRSILKAGGQDIIPATPGGTAAPNKVVINVLSVTQEATANIDVTFPESPR